MDLSIVVPCYNEEGNVPRLECEFVAIVEELAKGRSVEVVFVDDGSSDGTWTALLNAFDKQRRPQISVVFERHEVNRGLGAALRTGFAAARGDIIVTTDSDGTYDFAEIPNLLSVLRPDVDIVTASPYHPAGGVAGVPGYRLVLSRGSSTIYRVLADWRIHTYTALFRAYRRRVIERVSFESDGFLAGTELMVKAMLTGYRVVEYPTILHSRVIGTSKAKLMRTIGAHLTFQIRVLLHRTKISTFSESRQVIGVQE